MFLQTALNVHASYHKNKENQLSHWKVNRVLKGEKCDWIKRMFTQNEYSVINSSHGVLF